MSSFSEQTQSVPVFPGFIVVDSIGEGGMGAVYKAEKDNVTYALKMIHPESVNPQALARFQREALTAAAVDKHPNIVSIHKFEMDSPIPFLVMDYVEAQSLDKLIKKGQPWPRERVVELLKPIGAALDHMHSKGVIHRDLKPANILIRDHDKAPLITDFGIAKEASLETLTKTGEMLGTPEYMAPEQLDNARQACPQTDIWSLAVIGYELLTGGSTPFRATSLYQLAEDLLCKAPDLSALGEDHSDLIPVLQKAFNKDPEQRFADCDEFLCHLSGELEPEKPSRTLPLTLAALFLVILLSSTLAYFLWPSQGRTRPGGHSHKHELKALKNEIGQFQERVLAEHFYAHLIDNVKDDKHCVHSKKLYHRVIRLRNELSQNGFSKSKIEKRTERWSSFLLFVRTVEGLEQDKDLTGPAKGDLEKQVRAFQLLKSKPDAAADFVKFKPEHPEWRQSWLVLKFKIAQQKKLHSQSLEYLLSLKKEFPKDFPFESEIWLMKAKAASVRGRRDKLEPYKALFAYWRYQRLNPGFEIPRSLQFGLNDKGQLDVQKINKELDSLRYKALKTAFQLTVEAAKHGIYTDSLDNYRFRDRIHHLKLPRQLAQREPKNPIALFWEAYSPLLSTPGVPPDKKYEELLRIRKSIDVAIRSPQPSFYKAILHSHRANLINELAAAYPTEFSKDEFSQQALADLEKALQYPHPKPHVIHWVRFKVLLRGCRSVEDVRRQKKTILDSLESFYGISKKYYDEPATIRNKSLSRGRPQGIPFARFIDNNYEEFQTKYYGGQLSYYLEAAQWREAKAPSDKLLFLTTDPVSYQKRIVILNHLREYKQLILLRETIKKQCQASLLTKKAHIPFLKSLIAQIDAILAQRR